LQSFIHDLGGFKVAKIFLKIAPKDTIVIHLSLPYGLRKREPLSWWGFPHVFNLERCLVYDR